jgi:hypothetical protein
MHIMVIWNLAHNSTCHIGDAQLAFTYDQEHLLRATWYLKFVKGRTNHMGEGKMWTNATNCSRDMCRQFWPSIPSTPKVGGCYQPCYLCGL